MQSKPWYESRMVWFNTLALVVAVAQSFGYTGVMAESWSIFVPVIVAVINIVLRFITNQALTR